MSRKQTTDMKQWELIADQVRRTRAELMALHTLLSTVPKTVQRGGFDKTDAGLTKLKSDLEDRMAEEHPDTWDTDVFYGDNEHYDRAKDRVREQADALVTDERRAVIEAVDDTGLATVIEIEQAVEDRPFDGQNTSHAVHRVLRLGEERGVFTERPPSDDGHLPRWEINEDASW